MKFTAVGDILAQKRTPPDYKGFEEIRAFIGVSIEWKDGYAECTW